MQRQPPPTIHDLSSVWIDIYQYFRAIYPRMTTGCEEMEGQEAYVGHLLRDGAVEGGAEDRAGGDCGGHA